MGKCNRCHQSQCRCGPCNSLAPPPLIFPTPTPPLSNTFGFIYDSEPVGTAQAVALGAAVLFNTNGPLVGVSHTAGASGLTFSTPGIYQLDVTLNVATATGGSFEVRDPVSGVAFPGTRFGSSLAVATGEGVIHLQALITVTAGQSIAVFNVTTAGAVSLAAPVPSTPAGNADVAQLRVLRVQ